MLRAVGALAKLLDPRNGEKMLIFDEFPQSFFWAKLKTSSLANENTSPYTVDVNVTFSCTGPSYSITESIVNVLVPASPFSYTLTSDGDSNALPRYRYISATAYTGPITIENVTTHEKVTWTGTLAAGDVIDIVMDPEHGTPYSVFKNGVSAISSVTGAAWPHVASGDNQFNFVGPTSGVMETRWRDRWLIGKQSLGRACYLILSTNNPNPDPGQQLTLTALLSDASGPLSSKKLTIYHYLNGVRYNDYAASTDISGSITLQQTYVSLGMREYYAEFDGDEVYEPVTSNLVMVEVGAVTRLSITPSLTVGILIGTNVTFTAKLERLDVRTGAWVAVSGKGVSISHTLDNINYVDTTGATDSNGNLSITQAFTSANLRVYKATFAGDTTYMPAVSPTIDVNVFGTAVATISASTTTPVHNSTTVTFTATLKYKENNAPIVGVPVFIKHEWLGIEYIDITASTNITGQISVSQVFAAAGTRYYAAKFSGTAYIYPAVSAVLNIVVS
jgi:hypothetical protein